MTMARKQTPLPSFFLIAVLVVAVIGLIVLLAR